VTGYQVTGFQVTGAFQRLVISRSLTKS